MTRLVPLDHCGQNRKSGDRCPLLRTKLPSTRAESTLCTGVRFRLSAGSPSTPEQCDSCERVARPIPTRDARYTCAMKKIVTTSHRGQVSNQWEVVPELSFLDTPLAVLDAPRIAVVGSTTNTVVESLNLRARSNIEENQGGAMQIHGSPVLQRTQ